MPQPPSCTCMLQANHLMSTCFVKATHTFPPSPKKAQSGSAGFDLFWVPMVGGPMSCWFSRESITGHVGLLVFRGPQCSQSCVCVRFFNHPHRLWLAFKHRTHGVITLKEEILSYAFIFFQGTNKRRYREQHGDSVGVTESPRSDPLTFQMALPFEPTTGLGVYSEGKSQIGPCFLGSNITFWSSSN